MFKIALNAGHYRYENGRRVSKEFDPYETREWVLNARVCDMVEQGLRAYKGYSLIRTDDTSGERLIRLAERAAAANAFGADIYVSVHHNAGIGGGSGGGVMVYTYPTDDIATKRLQQTVYNSLVEKTGLKGNRATPLATADFAECRLTCMPAVLIECGFMDSATDAPVIITESFAQNAADAIVKAIVTYGSLEHNGDYKPDESDKLYKVQVGAYRDRRNAQIMKAKLNEVGLEAFIVAPQ